MTTIFSNNLSKSRFTFIKGIDILMMNDASCFLQGEIFGGAAVSCNHVVGVTLSTDLGSAKFQDDIIFDGDLYYTPFKEGPDVC